MPHPEGPNAPARERLIRRSEVERITGLPRSSIYERNAKDPDWPKPVRLGPNTVAWVESEVLAWVDSRIRRHRVAA
jgi:prophage regulatory protein